MRKFLPVLLLFQGFLSFAQKPEPTIINLWLDLGQLKSTDYYIYLNNEHVVSAKPFELIELRLFSKGYINLEILNTRTRRIDYSDQLVIENDSTQFLKASASGYPTTYSIDKVPNSNGIELNEKGYFSKTKYFEEDIFNPIGKIPDETYLGRPKSGSGFLIDNKGHLLTNFHVIENAEGITVSGVNGDHSTTFKASVVATDHLLDLALLKIESSIVQWKPPPYKFKSNAITGEQAIAFGYPIANILGNELKVTDGIINATSGYKNSISLYQFSAPVQPGNSGGPLLDESGNVIGIISAKINSSKVEAIGYAIKSDFVRFFLKQAGFNQSDYSAFNRSKKELSTIVEDIQGFILQIKTE